MIEKIPIIDQQKLDTQLGKQVVILLNIFATKINELCDIINRQQIDINNHECRLLDLQNQINEHDQEIDDCAATISKMENVAEDGKSSEMERRKWIGKLCRFWDDDAFVTSHDWAFGILTSIDKGMQFQYCCNGNCNFKHCEPVKPDDNIIYKGE